jgi:hypothetical protein
METNKAEVLLRQFNETIENWILWLDDYTLEMLCQKPKPGSWSLGQVYVHITDDTKYFVEQMKASLASSVNWEKGKHENARVMFANNQFPDMMLDGPATDSSIAQPTDKAELLQRLRLIKEEVNSLYLSFDISGSTGKTEHPGLRFFSALEWLQFAEMHMRHHFKQKKRIDDALHEK